jgi:hypothetical protein
MIKSIKPLQNKAFLLVTDVGEDPLIFSTLFTTELLMTESYQASYSRWKNFLSSLAVDELYLRKFHPFMTWDYFNCVLYPKVM